VHTRLNELNFLQVRGGPENLEFDTLCMRYNILLLLVAVERQEPELLVLAAMKFFATVLPTPCPLTMALVDVAVLLKTYAYTLYHNTRTGNVPINEATKMELDLFFPEGQYGFDFDMKLRKDVADMEPEWIKVKDAKRSYESKCAARRAEVSHIVWCSCVLAGETQGTRLRQRSVLRAAVWGNQAAGRGHP
jgi:hypothetical protein